MHLTLAHIGPRPASSTRSKDSFDSLTQFYLDRCSVFARCQSQAFRTEEALLGVVSRNSRAALPPWPCCSTAAAGR